MSSRGLSLVDAQRIVKEDSQKHKQKIKQHQYEPNEIINEITDVHAAAPYQKKRPTYGSTGLEEPLRG